ncbi:MAG: AraC family transcriptional regulator ligand-binding domain-containing protein [Geminicoccaceae bacterium]
MRWQPLAREHGLDLARPATPGDWVLARHQHAFARDAESLAGDPLFGWSLGAWDLRDLGLYGYSVLNAPDLRSALRLMIDLVSLETEAAQLRLQVQNGEAALVQTWVPITVKSASWLNMFLCALRQLIGPDFVPLHMGRYETDPNRSARLSDLVGMSIEDLDTPIAFVTFEERLLDHPVIGADEMLAQALQQCWLSDRADLAARHAELADLADAIVPLLVKGMPSLDAAACALGVSTAELRCGLDRIGCSLSGLVDAIRSGLSTRVLTKPDMTVVRATKALGFDEPDELSRAYERWWGRPLRNGYGRSLRYE